MTAPALYLNAYPIRGPQAPLGPWVNPHTQTYIHTCSRQTGKHHIIIQTGSLSHLSCRTSFSRQSFSLPLHVSEPIALSSITLTHSVPAPFLLSSWFALFFINFWLSVASSPRGLVCNARHFWVGAKQMRAPLLRPSTWIAAALPLAPQGHGQHSANCTDSSSPHWATTTDTTSLLDKYP